MPRSPLVTATLIGTALQLAMVVSGHYNPSIANLFGVLGMTISLVAGVLFALRAQPATAGSAAVGGLIAGGVCALIGILVSFFLGDVTAVIIALGTLSSAVAGAIGGAVAYVVAGRRPARA